MAALMAERGDEFVDDDEEEEEPSNVLRLVERFPSVVDFTIFEFGNLGCECVEEV